MELAGPGQWKSSDGTVRDIAGMNEHHRRAAANKVRQHMETIGSSDPSYEAWIIKMEELLDGIPAKGEESQ